VGFLVVILTLALIGLVAAVVSAPVRRARSAAESAPAVNTSQRAGDVPTPSQPHKRDEMEAAREAKYREIRDTELDFRTGKLSPEDYQRIDADLRAEAIEILNELDELKPKDA
jgi:Skp family chaperone for outer membrane proteins